MDRNNNELFKKAVFLAQKILSGELDPNQGCAEIGDINRQLGWPTELSGFGALAHDQAGHENLGITPESCIPDILNECKTLVVAFSSASPGSQS